MAECIIRFEKPRQVSQLFTSFLPESEYIKIPSPGIGIHLDNWNRNTFFSRFGIWNLIMTRNTNTFPFLPQNPSLITHWEKLLPALEIKMKIKTPTDSIHLIEYQIEFSKSQKKVVKGKSEICKGQG